MAADTHTLIMAAMYAAMGQQTKLSRSGHSIVFVEPQCGRNDLSDDYGCAAAQARSAGLDIDAITPEQVEAYQSWYTAMHEHRRIGEARLQITRPHSIERGHELVPVNSVRLLDGWGEMIDWRVADMEQYFDPGRNNRIGGKGAYCHRPDYARINRCVAELFAQHPEFSGARIQDNNQRDEK
jgi:hypothetical protein